MKDNGGPAFPHLEVTSTGEPYEDHLGMTLRDYFAAKVAAGDAAAEEWGDSENLKVFAEKRARIYYVIADAMIAERSKTQ